MTVEEGVMSVRTKVMLVCSVMTASAIAASADPLANSIEDAESETELRPPGVVIAERTRVVETSVAPRKPRRPLATTERWGGGVRITGLSGIGALPGVNYGGELSGLVRRDEMFVELAVGWWKPEETYVVTQTPERVELGLDVWTLRGGWASMQTPLRAWVLAEVGELASARSMPGVLPRMMTGDTPSERRWQALGAGFGVAWPMSDNARLFGMIEIAVPVHRAQVMLDVGSPYEPDPLAARSSAGLELGWR
jgi:hypothetical protein